MAVPLSSVHPGGKKVLDAIIIDIVIDYITIHL